MSTEQNGVAVGEERILRDVSQPGLFAQRASSGIGRFVAGQDLEQRGFAAAVGTDQTGAITIGKAQRKIFKQNARAETICRERRH